MYIKPNDREQLEAEIFISTLDDRLDSLGPRPNTQAVCYLGWLALQKCNSERKIAAFVKRKCDERFGKGWQCVVGELNFGEGNDNEYNL